MIFIGAIVFILFVMWWSYQFRKEFKEGRFYTYTPKKPHKLNKEKNNLINESKKEKEVAK